MNSVKYVVFIFFVSSTFFLHAAVRQAVKGAGEAVEQLSKRHAKMLEKYAARLDDLVRIDRPFIGAVSKENSVLLRVDDKVFQKIAAGQTEVKGTVYLEVKNGLHKELKNAKIQKQEGGGLWVTPPQKRTFFTPYQDVGYLVKTDGTIEAISFEVKPKIGLFNKTIEVKAPRIQLSESVFTLKPGKIQKGSFKVRMPGEPEALVRGSIKRDGDEFILIEDTGSTALSRLKTWVKGREERTVPGYRIMKDPQRNEYFLEPIKRDVAIPAKEGLFKRSSKESSKKIQVAPELPFNPAYVEPEIKLPQPRTMSVQVERINPVPGVRPSAPTQAQSLTATIKSEVPLTRQEASDVYGDPSRVPVIGVPLSQAPAGPVTGIPVKHGGWAIDSAGIQKLKEAYEQGLKKR